MTRAKALTGAGFSIVVLVVLLWWAAAALAQDDPGPIGVPEGEHPVELPACPPCPESPPCPGVDQAAIDAALRAIEASK